MKYYLKEEFLRNDNVKNAGNKARNDVEQILGNAGYEPLLFSVRNWYEMSFLSAQIHKISALWQALKQLKSGDELIIQFPMLHHNFLTNFLINIVKKRNVVVYFLIHDLEVLRHSNLSSITLKQKIRIYLQELSLLSTGSGIIAHNHKMKSVLENKGIASEKIVSLEIFDYLIPNFKGHSQVSKDDAIIIAGNLAMEKAGYLYSLPPSPRFNLYGVGFDESHASTNTTYFGSFFPDELPNVLSGSFGLVWDGEKSETCTGIFGEYLRYNNSHKASLYLASGFPLIVWKNSALSQFVEEQNCGITINSLYEIQERLLDLSTDEFNLLSSNAENVGKLIREGHFLLTAIQKLRK
ncbi:TPA: galactofuranosyltransferase [Streptococcus suis]|nr:galactofuranosyltransferase [Streptococcus suis]